MHGTSKTPCSDLDPVGTADAGAPPARMVAWRPQMERDVLGARDVLDTVIVRSALVYGREHGIWGGLFGPILEAAKKQGEETVVQVRLEPTSRPSLVHVDDVAQGLLCAVEKLPLISGTGVYPVFDLTTSQESMRDIMSAFAEAVGLKGRVELVRPDEGDVYAEAMQTTRSGDSGRAEQLLGWAPRRKGGLVAGMDVFAKAFVAGMEK